MSWHVLARAILESAGATPQDSSAVDLLAKVLGSQLRLDPPYLGVDMARTRAELSRHVEPGLSALAAGLCAGPSEEAAMSLARELGTREPVRRVLVEATLAIGHVVEERFLLLRALGSGAWGTVYEARDLHAGEGSTVALKLLKAGRAAVAARARFFREATALASTRHPNIVAARAVGEDPVLGVPYLAMEMLGGRTLSARLKEGPFEEGRAVRMAVAVLDALDAVHANGWVHADVTPPNVMLTETPEGERTQLLDFGLAQAARGELDRDERLAIAGTVKFMSPEVIGGARPEVCSDVFQVATLLYCALENRHPLGRGEVQDPEFLRRLKLEARPRLERVSARTATAVAWGLELDPRARPASARALRDVLGPAWHLTLVGAGREVNLPLARRLTTVGVDRGTPRPDIDLAWCLERSFAGLDPDPHGVAARLSATIEGEHCIVEVVDAQTVAVHARASSSHTVAELPGGRAPIPCGAKRSLPSGTELTLGTGRAHVTVRLTYRDGLPARLGTP